MRLFMDSMVALMLTAILAGLMWHNRVDAQHTQARELARAEVRRFQQQIALQAALAQVERSERGYPSSVEPEWFQGKLPTNPLLDSSHSWLEIAGPQDVELQHPAQRVAANNSVAKFWYNPGTGVVRARVPSGVSDKAAVDMYNFVNDSSLHDLFADGSSEALAAAER
jgi:type II secretory pathway pseudopilin PulG